MEESNLAAYRPTRTLVALVSALAIVQVPTIVVHRVLAAGRDLAPSAPQLLAARTLPLADAILLALSAAQTLVWLVVVHRFASNTIARGSYLRDSPTRMVLNYFLPHVSLFAPREDMLALVAANEPNGSTSRESRSLRASVNAWWFANIGSWLVSLVARLIPRASDARAAALVLEAVLSVAFVVLGAGLLRELDARIEPEELDLHEVFA